MIPKSTLEHVEPYISLIVDAIPEGKVMSYGQIGSLLPVPNGEDVQRFNSMRARIVGSYMSSSGGSLPWWRVLGSDGKISKNMPVHLADEQRNLLEQEGIVFDEKRRVNMAVYSHEFDEDWLQVHGLL